MISKDELIKIDRLLDAEKLSNEIDFALKQLRKCKCLDGSDVIINKELKLPLGSSVGRLIAYYLNSKK